MFSALHSCTSKIKDHNASDEKIVTPSIDTVSLDSFRVVYGLTINTFEKDIDTLKVKLNSYFTDFFTGYLASNQQLVDLSLNAKGIFDFRKFKTGNTYNIVHHNSDSGKVADYFIYHQNAYQKFVIDLQDSGRMYMYQLPIDTVERSIYAKIDRTLYHAIIDADVSYDLGIKLSEVFAWQVNFFRIDAKDHFKVIFDQLVVEGKPYDIGRIKAAEFYHRGDTFYAFNYNQDSVNNYFDEEGRSLRKAFLKAPLKYSRISSRYSKKRFHPVQKRWKAHLGTDYAAPTGTPIRSVGDGVVVASSYSRGNGNYVKVKHSETYTTQYLHMSKIAPTARNGKRVRQGDVIGYVGSTGLATGPHLCFRFWKNGVQIDPFTVKTPPSVPIKKEHEKAFSELKRSMKKMLQNLTLTAHRNHSEDDDDGAEENDAS
ncbi:MAG: murein DD-endopeptidase MepM/ murein hydrolase activator NlpD [Bacteroidia bacterium]|jgi:murein DD-endopeptidase MepM/ murein hydrolase activator NlpD